jgi:hypothetical protein
MLNTNFTPNDPFSLILAQDKIGENQDSWIENVWEIQFERGELGGISLYTTFSMRALGIRITPVFSFQNENRINTNQFHKQPLVKSACTSYARISTEIYPGVSAELSYWIPDSGSICGLVSINNEATNALKGSLQFIVDLKPLPGGEFISGIEIDKNFFLAGKTQNIAPVFYLSGNSHQGQFGGSSVESGFNIKPNDTRQFEWCLAFKETQANSVNEIQNFKFENFEKETTRVRLANASNQFIINTGNPEWDKVFLTSQKTGNQLIKQRSSQDQTTFLFDSVHPEQQNFSPEENWRLSSRITPLQLWYFSQVLPSRFEPIESGLMEFLLAQKDDGFIPNNLSLENPQSKHHAFPILAKISYELFSQKTDSKDLSFVLEKLVRYLKKWFEDKESNSSPYWENPLQSLYEDLPIHNIFTDKKTPVPTRWIDSPFLNTLLYQECNFCIKLANHFSVELPEREYLEHQKKYLLDQILDSWSSNLSIYRYRDIRTKRTYQKKTILKVNQAGTFLVEKDLKTPIRLSIAVVMNKEFSRNIQVKIVGSIEDEEIIETISARKFFWGNLFGYATTEFLFDKVNHVEITHLPEENALEIYTSNYSQIDLTCCLPISIESIPTHQKNKLVSNCLEVKFLSSYGLALVPKGKNTSLDRQLNVVDFPLNSLIIEALIQNQNKELGYKIFEKMMSAAILNLQKLKNSYTLYDADDGTCTGEYNIINGMIPLKLFFNFLGILQWSNTEIIITGNNYLENKVSIQYRDIKIICAKDGYTIFTSGGKSLELKENKIYKIKIPK